MVGRPAAGAPGAAWSRLGWEDGKTYPGPGRGRNLRRALTSAGAGITLLLRTQKRGVGQRLQEGRSEPSFSGGERRSIENLTSRDHQVDRVVGLDRFQRVGSEQQQVRDLAGLDRSIALIQVERPGRLDRGRCEQTVQRNTRARQPL